MALDGFLPCLHRLTRKVSGNELWQSAEARGDHFRKNSARYTVGVYGVKDRKPQITIDCFYRLQLFILSWWKRKAKLSGGS